MTPKQPALPLESSLKDECSDYIITDANTEMMRYIDAFLQNADVEGTKRLLISGDKKSGKTALIMMLVQRYDAVVLASEHQYYRRHVSQQHAFYDIDNVLSADGEVALFHALNSDAEAGFMSCLSTRPEIVDALTLPDLTSRIKAAQRVDIPQPDAEMTEFLFGKALVQRQLTVSPGLLEYAVNRLPRTYTAPFRCAEILDNAALERGCAVSVKLAAQCREAFED